jgi:hypothetical protein
VPHDHVDLGRLEAAYLDARTLWRVQLRVHLEEVHGVLAGTGDPEEVHDRLHGQV